MTMLLLPAVLYRSGQLFDIARWFFVQLDGGKLDATPKYMPPPPEPVSVPVELPPIGY